MVSDRVRIPSMFSLSTTGSRPMSCLTMRRAASDGLFPGAIVVTFLFINAFTGESFTGDDLTAQGKAILKCERDFNFRAGFTEKDDRLPEYFKKEPLAPHNITFQVSDEELDQVYNF